MKLNPRKIYRKAAELVEHNTSDVAVFGYSCLAIYAAVYCATGTRREVGIELVDNYVELFYPPSDHFDDEDEDEVYEYDGAWGDLWGDTERERNDCRVLALLFMSEIVRGE